jgi:hypothetical protein
MKVTADDRRRVQIPGAKPGDCFEVQVESGLVTLRLMEPISSRPAKVRIFKKGGYTVADTDRPIDPGAIKAALSDFP